MPDTPQPTPSAAQRYRDMSPAEQEAYVAESERRLDAMPAEAIAHADRLLDLRALRALVEQRDSLDRMITAAVTHSRDFDRSWSEIARVLGVTKQSAHARYADEPSWLTIEAAVKEWTLSVQHTFDVLRSLVGDEHVASPNSATTKRPPTFGGR
jgi:hypothetical protein